MPAITGEARLKAQECSPTCRTSCAMDSRSMSAPSPLNLGVLVSGTGTNLQAILDAISAGTLNARVKLVISSRPGVQALERARKAGGEAVTVSHKAFVRPAA